MVSGRCCQGAEGAGNVNGYRAFAWTIGERDWKTTTQRDVSISGPGDFFADVE